MNTLISYFSVEFTPEQAKICEDYLGFPYEPNCLESAFNYSEPNSQELQARNYLQFGRDYETAHNLECGLDFQFNPMCFLVKPDAIKYLFDTGIPMKKDQVKQKSSQS